MEVNPEKDTEGYTFPRLGLTDNSLIHLINDYVVLTNDEDIPLALLGIKPDNVLWYTPLRKAKFNC
ncbi:hypothetical protein DBL04_13265 [Acinetobacter seifertii]|nr:hypothetical protein DBL04_13265 [Acinetobacter seifertii]